ncbi:alpha/beta hydrolase [Nocardioides zeae]|uniref:Alpha/beta hydrolase n=1 Tax=Nocardioides imazamoxiresistens TaxID=3231893 RepID=A0ABU3PSB8_9ACTN|nr:alpha/beta hydrolase [Nocardioides zeae]MDT9592130.1 alpha/beta hydrolase [Nocardioides zeae]
MLLAENEMCDALRVDGADVRFVRTHPEDDSPTLLVHGGSAHVGWWFGLAPLLTDLPLLAMELSGHGTSDHRRAYSPDGWVRELSAVLDHAARGPVTIVGHSMGGALALRLAATRPDLVSRLVLLDVRVRGRSSARQVPEVHRVVATHREAVNSFRLRPRETTADADLLARVAAHGLRRVPGGWSWSFDLRTVGTPVAVDLDPVIEQVCCPVTYAWGEHSPIADAGSADHLDAILDRPVERRVITGAHHNVTLDDPEACARLIREALGRE